MITNPKWINDYTKPKWIILVASMFYYLKNKNPHQKLPPIILALVWIVL
jgi:hypothetical protein